MGELRNVFSVLQLNTGGRQARKIMAGVEQRTERFLDLDNKEQNVQEALERHFKGSEVFDKELLSYLLQIIEYCDNTDKNLILLRYPISSAYYKQMGDYIDLKNYEEQFQHLEKQIPENVP